MTFKIVLLPLLAAGCLSACDNIIVNTAPRVANIKPEQTRFETRALVLSRCPTIEEESSPPAPAFAPVVGLAIAAAVPIAADLVAGAVGSYLKARQDALAGNHYGTTSGEFYSNQGLPAVGCLVVARGDFGPLSSTVGTQQRGALKAASLSDAGLANFPDFYFEMKVSFERYSGETATMKLTPNLLQFAKTAAGRTANDAKNINLVLMMAQGPIDPKSPDKSKAFAIVPMQFEKVKIGTEIPPSLMMGRSTNVPVAGTAIAKSTAKNRGSFNLLVLVEETEKPSGFEELVVATYTGHQKDISAQIVAILKEALGVK